MEIAITGITHALLEDVHKRLISNKISITDVERFEDGFADIQFNIPNGVIRRIDNVTYIGNIGVRTEEDILTLKKDDYCTIILV